MEKYTKIILCIWGFLMILWVCALLADIWMQGLVNAVKDNYINILAISMIAFCNYMIFRKQQEN